MPIEPLYESLSPTADITLCPSCENGTLQVFHEVGSVPVNSCIQLSSAAEAIAYPRGDIRLGFCPQCGFISNVAFDNKFIEYSGRYESTQKFSATFSDFNKAMAQRIVNKYNLRQKHIIEIGCGNGEFLILLCKLGNNRGTGIDPAYLEEREIAESIARERIEFITDFYSEKYSSTLEQSDFLCCKMTLEHIHPTAEFIRKIRRSISDQHDIIIYFQIPNTTRIIDTCAFEDIYYEHCSYFSPGSLARLFRHCGFNVLSLNVEYGGQYLTVEARPASADTPPSQPLPEEENLDVLAQGVRDFPIKFAEKRSYWENKLQQYQSAGKKVVLWGSGSKGVAFLTSLTIPVGALEYVVDINPYRQGYYMPGTGHKIVGPDFLHDYRPDVIIVMNAMYCYEIAKDLGNMGLSTIIESL